MENVAKTAADLRAQADAIEKQSRLQYKGRVYIMGQYAFVHDGQYHPIPDQGFYREASEAEVQALRTIPEFAAALDTLRGDK